jgi:exodeoxyribonuclease V alpha subunit
MNSQILDRLQSSGIFSPLDLHFASFLDRLAENSGPGFVLAAALVSNYSRQGHICVDLTRIAGKPLTGGKDDEGQVLCPLLADWLETLRKSSPVGAAGEYKPLVLDNSARLYLYRYWDYQEKLVRAIKERTLDAGEAIESRMLKEGLTRPFSTDKLVEIDWQKVAVFTALIKRFCVISGGPGTGKTTTVASILALLLEQASPRKPRIALAAPTGKASARLQDAIGLVKDRLNCPDNIKEAIPEEASTIHRLLGSIPDSPYFHHNQTNPLPVDVVVVDEASMVDLALLSKLVQALPAKARLILLGDKDQLASVEAGAVLGDICDTGNVHGFSQGFHKNLQNVSGDEVPLELCAGPESRLNDCIVHLQKSYRFGVHSGIGALSLAANDGDGERAMRLLREGRYKDIRWRDLPPATDLPRALRDRVVSGFGDCLWSSDAREILRKFESFRILCALREGPHGVYALNSLVESTLAEQRLIESDKRWYRGRPVMITRNDYNLRLFNGDVGIVLPDPETGNELMAFFPTAGGGLRKLHPLRLPEHETVYVMTVHKSQGSEFDRILLVLPDRESPVLTRELIYTAITRAREGVEIWGREEVFRTAISRRIERMSGLRDALWGG